MKKNLKPIWIGLVIVVCILLSIRGAVVAQTEISGKSLLSDANTIDKDARDSVPGGPGYISVSPFSMTPVTPDLLYEFFGSVLTASNVKEAIFNFPITIPHGATITKLVGYFGDFDPSKNMIVTLYRDSYTTYERTIMAQVVSFGSAGYINASDTSIDYAIVDLSTYRYSIELRMPANLVSSGFAGARVDYSFPGFLPLLER